MTAHSGAVSREGAVKLRVFLGTVSGWGQMYKNKRVTSHFHLITNPVLRHSVDGVVVKGGVCTIGAVEGPGVAVTNTL